MAKTKTISEIAREWAGIAIALAALAASAKACDRSDRSLKLAERNAEPQFLLETDPLGTDLKPGPLKIVARLKNVGPVTAFRVLAYGRIEPVHAMEKRDISFSVPTAADQDIEPQHYSKPIFFGPEISLTDDDVERLKEGKASLTFTVLVDSERAAAVGDPNMDRPFETFRRGYDRTTGAWARDLPHGNPEFQTH